MMTMTNRCNQNCCRTIHRSRGTRRLWCSRMGWKKWLRQSCKVSHQQWRRKTRSGQCPRALWLLLSFRLKLLLLLLLWSKIHREACKTPVLLKYHQLWTFNSPTKLKRCWGRWRSRVRRERWWNLRWRRRRWRRRKKELWCFLWSRCGSQLDLVGPPWSMLGLLGPPPGPGPGGPHSPPTWYVTCIIKEWGPGQVDSSIIL